MRRTLLIGILFASAMVFVVGYASDSSPTEKVKAQFEELSVPITAVPLNDLLAGVPAEFVTIRPSSPFSIVTIGTPNTKTKHQPILYPLKLC